MKKPMLLIIFLGCIVVALSLVRITLEDNISTTGITLVDIQNQTEAIKDQNELLTVKYLQSASFTHIASQAKKLGYVPVSSEIDLSAPLPLALR